MSEHIRKTIGKRGRAAQSNSAGAITGGLQSPPVFKADQTATTGVSFRNAPRREEADARQSAEWQAHAANAKVFIPGMSQERATEPPDLTHKRPTTTVLLEVNTERPFVYPGGGKDGGGDALSVFRRAAGRPAYRTSRASPQTKAFSKKRMFY